MKQNPGWVVAVAIITKDSRYWTRSNTEHFPIIMHNFIGKGENILCTMMMVVQ